MNQSDQKVYVGNKLYLRPVWNLHRDATGQVYGVITFAGQRMKVWEVGSGACSHWTATKPEVA